MTELARGRIAWLLENWRGLAVITFVSLGYLLWLVFDRSGADRRKLVSDLVGPGTAYIAFGWSIWRFRGARDGGWRKAWAPNLVSLGILSYAVGDSIWFYYEVVLKQQPFPSWADGGYVLSAASLLGGTLVSPRRSVPAALRVRVLLDALMTMAAIVTFSWFFTLGPTVLAAQGSTLAKVLTAAYPLFDLGILFCILMLTAHPSEKETSGARTLLCLGVLSFVAADFAFAYVSLKSTYETGAIDAGWMSANLLLGFGAYRLRNCRPAKSVEGADSDGAVHNPVLWRSLLPYTLVPMVAALDLYVWRAQVHGPLADGVYIGSAALMGLVLIRQVFAIVENSRLYQFLQAAYRELEALATTDGMTGLPNHRMFQERFRRELAKSKESGLPVTLLLVDVDRFKAYNDQFGHPAGDEALRTVAKLLLENVRPGDLAARYGGEEFAAILPATDETAALVVAEGIRKACEAQSFGCRQVTLSVGVVVSTGGDAGAMIECADRALYAAKHGGRNRVAVDGAGLEGSLVPMGWSLTTNRQPAELTRDALAGPAGPLLRTILGMIALKSRNAERPSERVMGFCLRLAEELGKQGGPMLSAKQIGDLHIGALLHDIGKMGIPDEILNKPGPLGEGEWELVRNQTFASVGFLADVPELAGALPIVRSHHERWDGSGYPDRLSGTAIPIEARLLAMADTLNAMWSERPYRPSMEYPAIAAEVRKMAGTQFDPALVNAFLAVPRADWERLRFDDVLPNSVERAA